MKSVLAEQSF